LRGALVGQRRRRVPDPEREDFLDGELRRRDGERYLACFVAAGFGPKELNNSFIIGAICWNVCISLLIFDMVARMPSMPPRRSIMDFRSLKLNPPPDCRGGAPPGGPGGPPKPNGSPHPGDGYCGG